MPGAVITEAQPAEDWIVGEETALCPDVNGDGVGEIAIVHAGHPWRQPKCSIIYGSRSLPSRMDLSEVGRSLPGFRVEISHHPGEEGFRVPVPLGDVDRDGFHEIGFPVHDPLLSPEQNRGDHSYILFGRNDFPPLMQLEDLAEGWGVRFPNFTRIARGGDVDGDGFEEIIAIDYDYFPMGDPASVAIVNVLYGHPREPGAIGGAAFFGRKSSLLIHDLEDSCAQYPSAREIWMAISRRTSSSGSTTVPTACRSPARAEGSSSTNRQR